MKKIIIIGGGFAGIAAAIKTAQKGHEVMLLEKNSFLGGRWHQASFPHQSFESNELNNGQHLLSAAYINTLKLFEDLDCRQYFKSTGALNVHFREKNRAFSFDTNILPGKTGQLLALLTLKGLSLKSKIQIITFIAKIKLGQVSANNMTCSDVLQKYGQTDQAIERFWKPIIISALNSSPDKVAAKLLLTVLKKGLFGKKSDSALIYPTIPIGEIMKKVEANLPQNITIQKQYKVAIVHDNGKNVVVTSSNGEEITADVLISTVNFNTCQQLFHNIVETYDKFNKLEFSPIISASMLFDRPIMDELFTAMLGTNAEWIFNKNLMYKRSDENYRYDITSSASGKLFMMPHKDIIDMYLQEIKALFPESINAQLLDAVIIKEKYATPIFSPLMDANRPLSQKYGNVIITGDWTQTGYPATIEGSVISGNIAIKNIN